MNSLWLALKKYFVSGVLVVVPLILTYLVIKFLFETIDGLLEPLISNVLGYYTLGLGVLIILLIIILAGILIRNFVGARLHGLLDTVLARLPIIRPIYSGAKQLLEAITLPSAGSFQEVVLVEYPRQGVFAIGFLARRLEVVLDGHSRKFATVFIASTPTPISGMAILFPEDDIQAINMSVEEAVKFLVSGGVVSPELLTKKLDSDKSVHSEVINETR